MAFTMHSPILAFLSAFIFIPFQIVAAPVDVDSRPIVLDRDNPEQQQVGQLRYRGGLTLRSPESRFGGFSALGISTDGKRMISLSDRGHRFSAHLRYDGDGNLIGLTETDLSALAGLDGRTLQSKQVSDAESMSPGVEGEIIVSFERDHRLWRYLPGQTRPEPLPPPDGLQRLPENSGIEALTLLADGRLLALSEGSNKAQNAIGWVSDLDGWSPLTYRLANEFRVTGATTAENGDVFVLERYYTLRQGVAIRIRRIPAGAVTPGAELFGHLVAEIRPPLTVDNFEGIDIRTTAAGRTIVYLISDDNFSPLQSTLLMMFEVLEK